MIESDKGSIQERGEKRAHERTATAEDGDIMEAIQSGRLLGEVANQSGAEEGLAGIANEPAKYHSGWNMALQLDQAVSGKGCEQHKPPSPWRREQQGGEEDGVGRPKD